MTIIVAFMENASAYVIIFRENLAYFRRQRKLGLGIVTDRKLVSNVYFYFKKYRGANIKDYSVWLFEISVEIENNQW